MPRPFGLFDIAKRCPYISYRDIFTGTGCLSVFQMGFEALAEGGGEVGAGLGAGVEAGHCGEGVGFGDAGLGVEDALVEDVAAVADVADGGADLPGAGGVCRPYWAGGALSGVLCPAERDRSGAYRAVPQFSH